eukprot:5289479-Prymnesium_polylepis.1
MPSGRLAFRLPSDLARLRLGSRQVILDACSVNDKGEVVLRCQDGRPEIVVGPNDSIVFCTGQRNDQGFKLYTEAANLNKDGVFMCLPYSTNTPTNVLPLRPEPTTLWGWF